MSQESLERELVLAFSPLHKRAFGVAVGTAVGLVVFVLTVLALLRPPMRGPHLWLLRQYFYGYRVSLAGAFIGLGWGFLTGFVGGWFVAFCRNLVLAAMVFVARTRAELNQTRDFLDHI
jgi:hypothetical protein